MTAPTRLMALAGAGLLNRGPTLNLAAVRRSQRPPPLHSTTESTMASADGTEAKPHMLSYMEKAKLQLSFSGSDLSGDREEMRDHHEMRDPPSPSTSKQLYRAPDLNSCLNSCRSSCTSVESIMWPVWSGQDPDGVEEDGRLTADMLHREVDIRVRVTEMEAKGLATNGSFIDIPQDSGGGTFGTRGSILKSSSWLQAFVLHPTSNPILVWHIIGPLLLGYDIITIPLKAFPIPEHWVLDLIAIIITTYWSLDMLRSFLTGYEKDNTVEMRPMMISKKYLRSWFFLDFMTCVLDWAFIIGGSGGMFNKFWRTSRAVQAWRILRLVRLVRVVKFMNKVTDVADQALSLQALIAIRSIYIALAVGFYCHYMACYWFLVGDYNTPAELLGGGSRSWIMEYRFAEGTIAELYTVSFHWALAQSGFGPTNIYPTNNAERIYASCVSFAWLIIVAVTINLFAQWLTQLRETNKDRDTQRINLRKYLEQHEVSRKLTYKVLRCFRMNYKAHARRKHEEDIEFLRDLPLVLKVSLHKEVYLPVVQSHIFFQFLGTVYESMSVMISHLAVKETHYLAGETVFFEGMFAKYMFHVQIGRLDYYAVRQNMRQIKMNKGDWACEPALWLRWVLRGRMVTSCSCELMGIDVEKVQAILQDAKARGEDVAAMQRYAVDICEHFMECCPDTDLWRDFEVMQNKADEVLRSLTEAYPY
uniref:Cyclic nucleotide-binding domain-containing protein n=1 Tax=Alexandrium catenella TaxID=2925 RepID=A0A7S1R891_ALECA|eukprot:CAMPEP_0171241022 /NCGR_PEP_ID=MMETSP0790-20130122/44853_1 /TAXON_ID=2925 /ORGANISM="Alexandrium catenella, Strain OF101" /LENGTH=701 /DNA_ID=CAMNT_0011707563 /DNA_START=24 /DNA_END=2129 /DNA_ORIENTATION=-